MVVTDCNLDTGMDVFQPNINDPWDEKKIRHILRRMGFGASPEKIMQARSMAPSAFVDMLIDEAITAARPARPAWHDWGLGRYTDFQTQIQLQILEWAIIVLDDMVKNPFRARLNLFWHNHFVTRIEAYACPSWLYAYWTTIDMHSLGDFKQFLKEIGKTPAMLVFLNGVQNTRLQPNENYARELFELFTLGRDQGYTQQDITNAARALTGYNGFSELCAPINFLSVLHDPGPKTIFGKTANFNYDSLHDLIFAERGTLVARHIASKLYKEFISPEEDEIFINELASIILSNGFQMENVYRVLFKSERFFDEKIIGAKIKSPLEFFVSFAIENKISLNLQLATLLIAAAGENGQFIFNPPDVSGWKGDKDWITTSKLTQRWLAMDQLLYYIFTNQNDTLRNIPGIYSENTKDPYRIVEDIIEKMLPQGFSDFVHLEDAINIFKWEVPDNYYESGEWDTSWFTVPAQVAFLMQYIGRSPEFQLT